MKEQIENVPLQLIQLSAGSTGLCAGNTPEEAMVQGLNEIFERYVLQQIYIHRLTPPTIPSSLFKESYTVKRLEMLRQKEGLLYEIKDCSLGKGFPVIGLLLIDSRNNSYSFRLGADANPDIALQRCYTEAFQGIDKNKYVFNPINFNSENIGYRREYNQHVINGSGRFPECIFDDTPSYPFQTLVRMNQETEREELKALTDFVRQSGYTLYVRDNSFLNFPAYHLYIPGLSEVSSQLYSLTELINRLEGNDFTYSIPLESHIKHLCEEDLRKLYEELLGRTEQKIRLCTYNTSPYILMDRHLLLALLAFRLSDLESAFTQMSQFIRRNSKSENYYYAVRDYFYWRKRYGTEESPLKNTLKRIYGEKLANEVINDMQNHLSVFQHFRWPACFHCAKCETRQHCRFFSVLAIDVKIQKAYKENIPNQYELRKLFND